jgi:hypothetical protein
MALASSKKNRLKENNTPWLAAPHQASSDLCDSKRLAGYLRQLTQRGFFEPVEGRSADCGRVTNTDVWSAAVLQRIPLASSFRRQFAHVCAFSPKGPPELCKIISKV